MLLLVFYTAVQFQFWFLGDQSTFKEKLISIICFISKSYSMLDLFLLLSYNCSQLIQDIYRTGLDRNILHKIKRRKTNWIGHWLGRNCLRKHVFDGRIEETGRQGRRRTQLLDDPADEEILEIKTGSTRSRCVENSLWRSLWACRKTDCAEVTMILLLMMMTMMMMMITMMMTTILCRS
jgi:hypothetical protein